MILRRIERLKKGYRSFGILGIMGILLATFVVAQRLTAQYLSAAPSANFNFYCMANAFKAFQRQLW